MKIRVLIVIALGIFIARLGFAENVQKKEEIDAARSELSTEKRKAFHKSDTETVTLISNIDQYLESQSRCFENADKKLAEECIVNTLTELAKKENFIAQHEMGNMYENAFKDKKTAMKWYNMSLNNPKTPDIYKHEIEKDIQRLNNNKNQ